MRVIKFRAWDGNKMHTKDVCLVDGDFAISEDSMDWSFDFGEFKAPKMIGMQFTGLTDKNGVDIYEGDIVSDGKPQNDHCGSGVHLVEYERGGFSPFCIAGWECTMDIDKCEVVGNIHQNPELLEKQIKGSE